MSLLSGKFVIFFLCVFLFYFLVPIKKRWVVLLVGSYVFYLAYSIKLSVFLLLTTFTTFFAGKRLGMINAETSAYLAEHKKSLDREQKKEYKAKQTSRKKKTLAFAVIWNVGTLCILKYAGFVFASIGKVLSVVGLSQGVPQFSLLLPLGISFYTFQTVGYVIDVYRGKYEADTELPKYMLFVSFFPQIIQGPIARHDQLAHQLYEGHRFDYDRAARGVQLILWGLIKKLVLAERLALISNEIFHNYQNYAGITMFIGGAVYGMYMYADFSGGIDMVAGIAQIFGIDLAENFRRPYFATSMDEFWRRWHISLGNWMRDYVFYTLSLSKAFARMGKKTKKWFGVQTGKMIPAFVATFITFVLVGVWQGTGLNNVGYGFWNASIISMSIILKPVYEKMAKACHVNVESLPWRIFCMVRTFILCSLGRLFSGSLSLRCTLVMFKSLFTVWNPYVFTNGTFLQMGLTEKDWFVVFFMLLVLLVVGIIQERGTNLRMAFGAWPLAFRWLVYIAGVVFLVLFGVYGPGYSAAAFLYQQV